MSKKIGYAVAGLGVGMAHVDAAIASDKAELVAVCDLIVEKMEKVKAKCPNVKMYTDFDEMLKDEDIDIISIALPSAMHADFAVKALEAGKNVLVEKPLDITPDRAIKIEEARVRTGLKAGVVHQNRFNCDMPILKAAIDSGHLGKVFLGTFAVKWYRTQDYYYGWHGTWDMDGGGSLINQSVHTVDIMQWLMGEVESVSSAMGIYNHDIETEDMTASLIKFKSGAAATFVSTTCAYPGLSTDIQIYGTNGSVECDQDVLKTWKFKEFDQDFCDENGIDAFDVTEEEEFMLKKYGRGNQGAIEFSPEANYVVAHTHPVWNIIDSVIEDKDPEVMPMEAIKAVKIVNAIYESARTGKTVYID